MDIHEQHERKAREFLARSPFCYRNLSKEEVDVFIKAMTHDSFSNEFPECKSNERLEFLGDAILEFVACEHIFLNTDIEEGPMTDAKQKIVSNHSISESVLNSAIGLDDVIKVGKGHVDPITKSPIINETIRSDTFEAILGAIYLLRGIDDVRNVVNQILLADTRI
ncbi:MAG TPA: ribonuclease III domain-containing protein [Candidatus Methanomethylophilaceae archaeon]|nr:ribonuclease III domain-containing protein [Candidatus Methanomethylophilaceae archaeon]